MTGPSLHKTAALSAVLHVSFVVIASVIMRHSWIIVDPSPYIVNLVGPLSSARAPVSGARATAASAADDAAVPADTTVDTDRVADKIAQLERLSDRKTEIASKKRIEKIVRLRKLVSIGGHDIPAKQGTPLSAAGGQRGVSGDAYIGKITQEIRSAWIYPDMGDKNLETIVTVGIMRDGTLNVKGMEKSSGNSLYDRSVLRAIAKASPVTPPPYEMELGIRFYP